MADNLQRQVLFTDEDARTGAPKAHAAARHLARIGSGTRIVALGEHFDADVYERLDRPDVVVDGTDNFATRYVINDLAARDRIAWVYGGVLGAAGSAAVVLPGETPCLRCWVPSAPPAGEAGTCETVGVLAPAVEIVAAFQSAETLKLLAGRRGDVTRGVLWIDVWEGRYGVRLAAAGPAADCPVCSGRGFPALERRSHRAVTLCGRDTVQVRPAAGAHVDLDRLAVHLEGIATDIERTPHLLRFTAERCRFSVFRGGRALLLGIRDPGRARILYDRYVGVS